MGTHHIQTECMHAAPLLYPCCTSRLTHPPPTQTWLPDLHTRGCLPHTEPKSACQVCMQRGVREHPDKERTSMNTHQLPAAYVFPTRGTPVPSPTLTTHVLTPHLRLLTLPKRPSPVHSPSVLNTARQSHRPRAHAHGRHGGLCAHRALMLRSPLYPEQGGQIYLTVRPETESYQVKQFIGSLSKCRPAPQLHRPPEGGIKRGVVSRSQAFS